MNPTNPQTTSTLLKLLAVSLASLLTTQVVSARDRVDAKAALLEAVRSDLESYAGFEKAAEKARSDGAPALAVEEAKLIYCIKLAVSGRSAPFTTFCVQPHSLTIHSIDWRGSFTRVTAALSKGTRVFLRKTPHWLAHGCPAPARNAAGPPRAETVVKIAHRRPPSPEPLRP